MIVEWILVGIVLLFGFVVFRGAPYVPSRKRYIREAFTDLYQLSHEDTLIDVGSGDGIVLRQAADFGARAIGYELNPALVLISRLISRGHKGVEVHLADFWVTQLPPTTTVVYAFMVTRDIKKFVRKMQNEATRLQRPLALILYGNEIPSMEPKIERGAYRLYAFIPSLSKKV
jgi:hypothetical protein